MVNAAQSSQSVEIKIVGITQSVIQDYFAAINAGNFEEAAALFAEDGILYPPFDSPIVGPEAIAHYLATEAKGMQLHPLEATSSDLENGDTEFQIAGKVQTPLFGVNVAWLIILNSHSQIVAVKVKLLAALEELLKGRC
jgi:hypothetical protein